MIAFLFTVIAVCLLGFFLISQQNKIRKLQKENTRLILQKDSDQRKQNQDNTQQLNKLSKQQLAYTQLKENYDKLQSDNAHSLRIIHLNRINIRLLVGDNSNLWKKINKLVIKINNLEIKNGRLKDLLVPLEQRIQWIETYYSGIAAQSKSGAVGKSGYISDP